MTHSIIQTLRRGVITAVALLATVAATAGEPDTYNYRQGTEAYNNGDYEKARKCFEKELKANDKNGYAYYWLALVSMKEGNSAEALPLLTKAEGYLTKDENDSRAMCCTLRANISLASGDVEQGKAELKAAMKYKPQKKMQLVVLTTYENYNLMTEATALLEQMISTDPGDPVPLCRLAGIKLGEEDWPGAIKFYTKALDIDDTQGDVLSWRSVSYLRNGDAQEAVNDLFRALDLDERTYSLRVMSQIADDEKVSKLLIAELQKRSQNAKDNCWPYYLAQVYQNTGAPDKDVMKYFKQALAIEKGTNLYTDIADLYEKYGLSDKALATLDEAIAYDKKENGGENLAQLYDGKASVCLNKGDMAEAIAWLDKAIEEQEDGDFYDSRGLYKASIGKDAEAIDDLNKAEELDCISNGGLFWRGLLYHKQGNTMLAEASLRKSIERDSVGTPVAYTFVSQHFLGLDDRAKDNVALCLADTTLGIRRFYHAAMLYSVLGDRTMVIHRLKQIFETPDNNFTDYQNIALLRFDPFLRDYLTDPELLPTIAAAEQRIKQKQRELEE